MPLFGDMDDDADGDRRDQNPGFDVAQLPDTDNRQLPDDRQTYADLLIAGTHQPPLSSMPGAAEYPVYDAADELLRATYTCTAAPSQADSTARLSGGIVLVVAALGIHFVFIVIVTENVLWWACVLSVPCLCLPPSAGLCWLCDCGHPLTPLSMCCAGLPGNGVRV